MTLPSVVLPQPDSPTRPSVSPSSHVEADAVDGADRAELADAEQAAADVEVLDEVGDLERATCRRRRRRARRCAAALVWPPLVIEPSPVPSVAPVVVDGVACSVIGLPP